MCLRLTGSRGLGESETALLARVPLGFDFFTLLVFLLLAILDAGCSDLYRVCKIFSLIFGATFHLLFKKVELANSIRHDLRSDEEEVI